jgi:hypothetical protein
LGSRQTSEAEKAILILKQTDYEEERLSHFTGTLRAINNENRNKIIEYGAIGLGAIVILVAVITLFNKVAENSAFKNAVTENTIESFEAYLSAYPDGKNASNARLEIENQSWEIAEDSNSEELYRAYLTKYPTGKYKDEAEKKLNEINSQKIPGMYPDASVRLLTYRDIDGLSSYQLKIMRNEIFARHGYIFKTDAMRNHFRNQGWYQKINKLSNNDDALARLSQIEKTNIAFIKKYE